MARALIAAAPDRLIWAATKRVHCAPVTATTLDAFHHLIALP